MLYKKIIVLNHNSLQKKMSSEKKMKFNSTMTTKNEELIMCLINFFKTFFFSSESDKNFPAIGLGTPEGRGHLTAKTMAAFRYIYEYHFNDADWFMKVKFFSFFFRATISATVAFTTTPTEKKKTGKI